MAVALVVRGRAQRLLSAAAGAALRRKALKLLLAWKWQHAELSIVLTDDVEMRALNRRWRGLDRTTDVLSFSMDAGPPMLGDIVISVEAARRQARRGFGLARELEFLLVHGFLHLAGFDHQRIADRRRMRAQERRLITLLAFAKAHQ